MKSDKYRINENPEKVKLDAKDRKIIVLLSEDARIQASEIAKKVMLSRDAVAYRIKRMQEHEVILLFFPNINPQQFSYSTYHLFFLMDEKQKNKQNSLINYLKEHKNTKSVMAYTDTWDVQWTLVAKNTQEFDKIITELTHKFPDVIIEKEKIEEIKSYISIHIPYFYYTATNIEPKQEITVEEKNKENIDDFDKKLLKSLAENCRKSSYEIAKELKTSSDTVLYRLKKLMKTGTIEKFSTLLNLSNMGYNWYTYAISFKKFDAKDEAKFREFTTKHKHIIEAVKLFGNWDVMMYIVADSLQNYHDTVKEIKNTFADIIYKYQTWLAHKEIYFTALPKIILEKNNK